MILKYLPICLLAFSTATAQQTLSSQEPSPLIALAEETPPFVPMHSTPEVPIPSPVAAPYCSDGESAVHFFVNLNLGFGNKTMATYANVSTTGGGARYGVDAGATVSLACRHNGLNLISASLGYNSVSLKDRYSVDGPSGATNNEFNLKCVSLPIMLTTTYFGSRKASGIYLRAGATLDYAFDATSNKKEWNNDINKFGFAPLFSFGWALMYNYESRTRSGTNALTLGPFVSYNVMNMLSTSGCSLRYMTIGLMYTGIRF